MFEDYKKLPPHVKTVLQLPEYDETLVAIQKKHKLTNEQITELIKVGHEVISKKEKVEGLSKKIQDTLKVNEDQAKKVAIDYIGFHLFPIQDHIGNVTSEIAALGGTTDVFAKHAAQLLTAEKLLWDALGPVFGEMVEDIDTVSGDMRANLVTTIINVLNKKTKVEELKDLFIMTVDAGGLGASEQLAEPAAEFLKDIIAAGEFGLDQFQEIDAVRKKVLGKNAVSVFENRQPITVRHHVSNALTERYAQYAQTPEVQEIRKQLELSGGKAAQEDMLHNFFEAINKKNKTQFLLALSQLFSTGTLKEIFKTNDRYIAFWRKHVLQVQGLDKIRIFDENPAKPVFITSFIKYVLEHRFEIVPEESVLWGVYISSLAHHAGDSEYEKLAYGDMKDQTFKWHLR